MRIASRQRTLIDSTLEEDQNESIKVRDVMQKLNEFSRENDSFFDQDSSMKNKKISEDYARGIPDFALSQISSDASDELKSYIRNHILQTSKNPVEQRKRFAVAVAVVDELEKEMKQLLEDKLTKFIRMT